MTVQPAAIQVHATAGARKDEILSKEALAFLSSLHRKFDGRRTRFLHPQEIGQIAGRAGRYQKNGTFGVTFRYLVPGDYAVSFQAPPTISAFTTDPAVPATVTVVSGQAAAASFVLLTATPTEPQPPL